jgi:hypothetical protein
MMISMNGVRRRKDGSIDTGFYVAIGNRERGRVMRAIWARLFRRSAQAGSRLDITRRGPRRGIAAGR